MKAPGFDYLRARELDEALAALRRYGGDARILAGGQSLLPALNFRLDAPAVLIDINPIAELTGIERQGDVVRIGALTRHAEIENSPIVSSDLPLVAAAIRHVAHPAIRNRGTIGGSLALADPAAELPACMVALGAELVLAGESGRRVVPAGDFFRGLFETARRPDEILVEARVPCHAAGKRWAFAELSRRHGDFAVVGIACQVDVTEDRIAALRLVVFGSEPYPRIARHVAAAASGQHLSEALRRTVVEALESDIDPIDNLQGSEAMKRHLARVLAGRAVTQLLAT